MPPHGRESGRGLLFETIKTKPKDMKNLKHIIQTIAAPVGCIAFGIAALSSLHEAADGSSHAASLMFYVCALIALLCFLRSCRQANKQ